MELEGVSDLLRFPLCLCGLEFNSVRVDLFVWLFWRAGDFFLFSWHLASGCLASGFWILVLVFGFWLVGFWLLAFGFWLLDCWFFASGLLALWFLADRFIDLTAKQMWQDRVVGLTAQNFGKIGS